jgi:hypothetical protein
MGDIIDYYTALICLTKSPSFSRPAEPVHAKPGSGLQQ